MENKNQRKRKLPEYNIFCYQIHFTTQNLHSLEFLAEAFWCHYQFGGPGGTGQVGEDFAQ